LNYTDYSDNDKEELKIENQFEYYVTDYEDFFIKSKPENYNVFLKKTIETFDLFGVGLALAYAWRNTCHILLKTPVNIATLNSTIFGMIRPDIYDRYDLDTAIGVYEFVLQPLAEYRGMVFKNNELI
jgi:hypothetical protein